MGNKEKMRPADWEAPSWNMWQGFFLLLVYSLLFSLLQMVLGWSDLAMTSVTNETILAYVLAQGSRFVLGAVLVWVGLLVVKGSWAQVGIGGFRLRYLLMGLAAGVGLAALVSVTAMVLEIVLEGVLGSPVPQSIEQALLGGRSLWQIVLLVLCSVVLIPMVEELLFRGVLYPPMRHLCGPRTAIVLVALLFAAMHGDLFRFLPLFVGALGLTFLMEKTKSLWPGIVAHGVWNLIMVVLVLWQGGSGNG